MKKLCDSCGGSGQISFFKGVSRFLLSTEECLECSGLGYILTDAEEAGTREAGSDDQRNRLDKKQKK